jgi:hypothetical protein
MHLKVTKKMQFRATKVSKEFTSETLTSYSGLTVINDYVNQAGIFKALDSAFSTVKNNATKILNIQIFSAIIFSSLSGINRLSRIEKFSQDPLVRKLLGLNKNGLDDSNVKHRLSRLGQRGANKLLETSLGFTKKWVKKCGLSRITIDCDSTEQTVFGHQEGSAKGYNPKNRGKLSYHPLICFLSEMKIVVNTWFRTGSAYTSNGIVEFMKQTLAALPGSVKTVFFRADSGFFNGQLFELLENNNHEYLVKAKLTGTIKQKLTEQNWIQTNCGISVCEFDYQAHGWSKARQMYGVRITKGYVKREFFGTIENIPVYDYFCYCSNIKGLTANKIHTLYGERAESENWIENTKNQLCAGQTITNDFHVNDILWQLSVLAYNISVLMRYESDYKIWKQEHKTFREWFILVPGKVVTRARKIIVKMSKHYILSKEWVRLTEKIPIAA